MKYYVTKYWQTRGIIEVDHDTQARPSPEGYLSSYEVPKSELSLPSMTTIFVNKREWFRTLDEAREDVKRRAKKKIPALRNKLSEVEVIANTGNVDVVPFPSTPLEE